jgi:hypothetical protein
MTAVSALKDEPAFMNLRHRNQLGRAGGLDDFAAVM